MVMVSQLLAIFFYFFSILTILSLFKSCEYYGVSIINFKFRVLIPSMHSSEQGKIWVRRYWFFFAASLLNANLIMLISALS